MLPRVIKNFNIYIDGSGWAGRADAITLPAINFVTEDHRAGGMDAPKGLELGMEKLTTSMVLADWDPTVIGLLGTDGVNITARAAAQRQGANPEAIIVNMRGMWQGFEFGEWRTGTKSTKTITADLDYFRYRQNEIEYAEIDVVNMIRVINGNDQLSAQRAALGM